MPDPIYDLYLAGGEVRKKLLLTLRRLARSAGLDNHGVDIRSLKSNERDEVEVRADLFAKEMKGKPGLHARLRRKVSSIVDIDLESFPNQRGHGKIIVGKRAAEAITGKREVMPNKARRNKIEERQLGVKTKAAGREVSSVKGQSVLELEHRNSAPIKLAKAIRDVTVQDIRALLDVHGCDGVTAFKVLTIAVFAKQSHKLIHKLTPSRRTRSEKLQSRQARIDLDKPQC